MRQLQLITIILQLIILIIVTKKEIIKNVVPQNAKKKLQVRKNFLNIPNPAGICWETPFVINSPWGTLRFLQAMSSQYYCFIWES